MPAPPATARRTARWNSPSVPSPRRWAATWTKRAWSGATTSWFWWRRPNSSAHYARSSARRSRSSSPRSCPRTSPGSTPGSSSGTSRKEVGERPDLAVLHAVERSSHGRIRALVVAVGPHFRFQVVLALPGQARHLFLAAEVGEMADAAAQLLRQGLALAEELFVGGPRHYLDLLLGEVLGELLDLLVAHARHQRRHHRRLADSLAEQHQLVFHEQPRLPGDGRDARRHRISARAMAGGAGRHPVLGMRSGKEKGGGQESPPPLAEHRRHYCFFAAAFFGRS